MVAIQQDIRHKVNGWQLEVYEYNPANGYTFQLYSKRDGDHYYQAQREWVDGEEPPPFLLESSVIVDGTGPEMVLTEEGDDE